MIDGLHISADGFVTDSQGHELGMVSRIEFPNSRDGKVWTETVWESRRMHEVGEEREVGEFPAFPTRDEAAEWFVTGKSHADHVEDELHDLAWRAESSTRSAASARKSRDEAIRRMLSDGWSAYRLAQVTGLSQTMIHKIEDRR